MAMTKEELNSMREKALHERPRNWIRVGYSTCGIAAGAREVLDALREEARARNVDVHIQTCGCVGMCSAEPLVEVNVEGAPHVFYGKVDRDVAQKIMDEHVGQKKLVENHVYEL